MADIATKAAIAGASTVAAGGGIYGITELATKEDDSIENEVSTEDLKSAVGTKTDTTELTKDKQISKDARTPKATAKITVTITYPSEGTLDVKYRDKVLDWVRKKNLLLLVKSDDNRNESWWNQAFQHKYKTNVESKSNLHDIFKGIEKGFSTQPKDKSLNQACESAYKEDKNNFKKDNYLLQNIGEFCNKDLEPSDVTEPNPVTFSVDSSLSDQYKWGVLNVLSNRSLIVEDSWKNEFWWLWAFKNLYTKNIPNKHSLFTSVSSGYSTNTTTTLNKVCDSAYKTSRKNLNDNKAAKDLFDSIAAFCTPGKSSPKLVQPKNWIKPVVNSRDPGSAPLSNDDNAAKDYTTGIGKYPSNRSNLIHPFYGGDGAKKWWTWKYQKAYLQTDLEDFEKLPKPFDKVTEPYNREYKATALNWACSDAYKDDKADQKLFEKVKEFCSGHQNSNKWEFPLNK